MARFAKSMLSTVMLLGVCFSVTVIADTIPIKQVTWVVVSSSCNAYQQGNTGHCEDTVPSSCPPGQTCTFTLLSPNPLTYSCDCR